MNFHYCKECDLVYPQDATDDYFTPGNPMLTGARACPIDGSKLREVDEEDVDLGVVDYLA